MENAITMTSLFRQIDGEEGVSWCEVGSIIITEHHSMFAVTQ